MSQLSPSEAEILDRRILALQRRFEELQNAFAELQQVERDLNTLKNARDVLQRTSSLPEPPKNLRVELPVVSVPPSEPPTVVNIILNILKSAGRPLTTSEIFTRYTRNGGTSNRATAATSLQRLMNTGRIKRVGTGTYEAI